MSVPTVHKHGFTLNMSWERLLGGPARKGRYVTVPKPEKWLRKRASFLRKWEAMQREGERQGFIEWEPEEGYVPTTRVETKEWVSEE